MIQVDYDGFPKFCPSGLYPLSCQFFECTARLSTQFAEFEDHAQKLQEMLAER